MDARGSRTSWSPRRAALALPVALYALCIPLVGNLQVDRGFRVLLYQNRSYAVLATVALAIAALFLLAPRRVAGVLQVGWRRQLIVAAMLFPVFYAAAAVFKGRSSVPVIGLYFVWAAAVFFVVPVLVDTPRRFGAVVAALCFGNASAWLVGYYLYKTAPPVTTLPGRQSFGYSNPNTYAQILQVVACCAVYFSLAGRERLRHARALRLLLIGVSVLCVFFVVAARSRNVMAFGIAATAVYILLRSRQRILLSVALGAAASASILALSYVDLEDVDRYSSGRLTTWTQTIDVVFVEGDNAGALLFGTDRDLSRLSFGARYHDIREAASFEKAHFDNFYLELMVESGVIGTLLFLWPYVLLFILLWRLRRDPHAQIHACLGLALLAGLAVQGNFAATIPSFNSPIGFMFAMVAVSLPAAALGRRQEEGR